MARDDPRSVFAVQLADEGSASAQRALELSEHPNRFLSTVQIGISLVGVVAGAFGGATLAFALVVLTITYLSLVIGELVPKRIALNNPERLAMRVAGFMHGLSLLATPLVRLLSLSTEGVLRLLRGRESGEPAISEEEIAVMIEQGLQAGIFKDAEQEVIENVFWLDERSVASVITPRREVMWLDLEAGPEVWLEQIGRSAHSRFLVARGQLDRFVGVDEYGGIEGIVTMDDLSDALLGELAAEDENHFVRRDDGSWLIDGRSSADEVQARLGLLELPGNAEDYETLGGMIITLLGHIPKPADTFSWGGYRFEIVDMDGARIDKVLVSPEVPLGEWPSEAAKGQRLWLADSGRFERHLKISPWPPAVSDFPHSGKKGKAQAAGP